MDEPYEICRIEQPDDEAWSVIGGGIHGYNVERAGDGHGQMLCLVVRGPDGAVVGGFIGETHWDWLYINLLFLPEELRGRGLGHRLLTMAEDEARRRGAANAYLDTFSFQAPAFYARHGYEVFGELPDFPPGHTRYYLRKRLV